MVPESEEWGEEVKEERYRGTITGRLVVRSPLLFMLSKCQHWGENECVIG